MRRIVLFLFGIVFMLSGCNPGKDDSSSVIPPPDQYVSNEQGNDHETEWTAYQANSQTYYQTYGWLSNDEIVFAEYSDGTYIVNAYNFQTGEKKEIFRENVMLIDVKIHPSKKFIALHVSETPASARIIIITPEGTKIGETDIESSEVNLSWNDGNPSLMLITAFYEDWSYNLFVYEIQTGELKEVDSPDPFLKWLDDDTLLSMEWTEHALNGAEVKKIDWRTGESTLTDFQHVVFLEANKGSVLTVEPIEEESMMLYQIRSSQADPIVEWTAPALSNYSQWFIPEVQWLDDGSMITLVPEKGGLVDEATPEFRFIHVKNGKVKWLDEKVGEAAFNCSPDGLRCLSGYENEQLIQFKPRKVWKWLSI